MTYSPIATRLAGIGTKRVCVSCSTRFYDLARTPPVCPKCGTEQPPEPPRPPPMRRAVRMRPMRATGRPAGEEEAAAGTEAPLLETEEEEDDDAVEDEAPEPEEDDADEEKPEEEAEL